LPCFPLIKSHVPVDAGVMDRATIHLLCPCLPSLPVKVHMSTSRSELLCDHKDRPMTLSVNFLWYWKSNPGLGKCSVTDHSPTLNGIFWKKKVFKSQEDTLSLGVLSQHPFAGPVGSNHCQVQRGCRCSLKSDPGMSHSCRASGTHQFHPHLQPCVCVGHLKKASVPV
jgi:hypothetical protein